MFVLPDLRLGDHGPDYTRRRYRASLSRSAWVFRLIASSSMPGRP